MDKTDYEAIKDYYDCLEGLKESGEIVNVYGGFEADVEVLGDFAEFFYIKKTCRTGLTLTCSSMPGNFSVITKAWILL